MAMVVVAAILDGTDDEDDYDNDDVEHDAKSDCRLASPMEQHNSMSSTTGATARRKIMSNT